jgi:hypothetical protein
MALARSHAGEHDEIDPIGLDAAVDEWTHEIIVSRGEVQLQSHHCNLRAVTSIRD